MSGKRRAIDAILSVLMALPWLAPVSADVQTSPGPDGGIAAPTGFFARAADQGIFFSSFLNEELAGNPSGGIRQGATASQYATLGADLDLQRVMAWQGGALHAIAIAEKSTGLSQKYIGGGVDAQENFAPFNFVRFLTLTLEQKLSLWNKGDLDIEAGRTAALPAFAASSYTMQFMNHAFCGVLYGLNESTGTAVAPLSSWGGRAKLTLTPKTYLQFGAYATDGSIFDAGTRLFDFGTGRVTGTNYLGEIGYETNFSNDSTPRYYRLGLSYLDAPRNDVLLNGNRLPLYQFGGIPLIHQEETAIYATGGQVVARPELTSSRTTAVFGSAYFNLSDFEAIRSTFKGGVVQTGPFASRPNDTLCVGAAFIAFTSKEVELLSAQRAIGGGSGRVHQGEFITEINYGYVVAPGVTVRPNFQYIVHPDSRYTPTYPRDIPHPFVIGLQITASLDTLFGLPHPGQ